MNNPPRWREYTVQDLLQRVMRRWPVLFGLGLIGGFAGYIVGIFRAPVYQAEALIGVNVNYGVSEPLELVVEERVLNRIAEVLKGDSTLTQVLDLIPKDIREARGWWTPSQLRESLRLERRLAVWALIAVDEDPAVAFEVSTIWGQVSLYVLDEAMQHAWRAAGLMGDSTFIVGCERDPGSEFVDDVHGWICTLENIQLEKDALAGKLATEIELSRGMIPNISYELLQMPMEPTEPIIWSRGYLVLMGAVLGVFLGLLSTPMLGNSSSPSHGDQ